MILKRFRLCALILVLAFSAFFPAFPSHAEGEANMDGGGGGYGSAEDGYVWSGNREGVRVTVVRTQGAVPVTSPVDFSNGNNSDVQRHFGGKSKLSYIAGSGLSVYTSGYSSKTLTAPLPKVIGGNMAALKLYFTDTSILQVIASRTGMSYDLLTDGHHRLLIEPIAYATVGGVMTAFTATEGALLNQQSGNKLRSNMPSLSHQNLPLSIFLEQTDLGIAAWTGARSGKQTDIDIIRFLGVGVVRFANDTEESGTPLPPPPDLPYNVVYRTDTKVFTTITVRETGGYDHNPDNPVTVTMSANGQSGSQTRYIPAGSTDTAWLEWVTPSVPGYVTISASSSPGTSVPTVTAKIIAPEGVLPPDPLPTDRYDSYHAPAPPSYGSQSSGQTSWDLWKRPSWHAPVPPAYEYDPVSGSMVMTNPGKPGWWEWLGKQTYTASATAKLSVTANKQVPTASADRKTMRSGYGFDGLVTVSVAGTATTGQLSYMYFPEFNYKSGFPGAGTWDGKYTRRMVPTDAAGNDLKPYQSGGQLVFRKNLWSTYAERVHFTPVWYKDGTYTAYAEVLDIWTPGGMITSPGQAGLAVTDQITITGSVFDDWIIAPVNVDY